MFLFRNFFCQRTEMINILYFVGFFLLVQSCKNRAENTNELSNLSSTAELTCSQLKNTKNISYENIVSYVRGKNVSVDLIISCLPQELRERFVLVFNSKSPVQASFSKPRVILFNEQATLLLAFHTDPDSADDAYNKLEIMQFRDKAEGSLKLPRFRWDMHEISYSSNWLGTRKTYFTDSLKPNPASCLKCHQSVHRSVADPRPNWDSYSSWPGVYGSTENSLPFNYFPIDQWDDEMKAEYEGLQNLVSNLPTRLDLLSNVKESLTIGRKGLAGQQVLKLSVALMRRTFERAYRLMSKSPSWPNLKESVLYYSLGCDSKVPVYNINDFFLSYFQHVEDWSTSIVRSAKIQPYRLAFGGADGALPYLVAVLLEHEAELKKYDRFSWTISDFGVPIPTVPPYATSRDRGYATKKGICSELAKAHKPVQPKSLSESQYRQLAVSICSSCHMGSAGIKPIDFVNKDALRKLKEPIKHQINSGKMPPKEVPRDYEDISKMNQPLLRYLEIL